MQRTCSRSAQPVRQPRYGPTPAAELRATILEQLRLAYRRGSGWCWDTGQLWFWFRKDNCRSAEVVNVLRAWFSGSVAVGDPVLSCNPATPNRTQHAHVIPPLDANHYADLVILTSVLASCRQSDPHILGQQRLGSWSKRRQIENDINIWVRNAKQWSKAASDYNSTQL